MDIGIMAISRNIHRSPTLGGAGTMTQMDKQEVLLQYCASPSRTS